MSYRFNGRSLLEAAASPLTVSDLARLEELFERQRGKGPSFVCRWSPETGVCVTALVNDGELGGWVMFPAASEAAAKAAAVEHYIRAAQAVAEVVSPAADAATQAIERARRR